MVGPNTRLEYALANLPARKPRGSRENIVRYHMMYLMAAGYSREDAEKEALKRMKEAGVSTEGLVLQYRETEEGKP